MDADQVRRCRREAAKGIKHRSLAKRYALSLGSISSMANRSTYRNVPDPSPDALDGLFANFPTAELYERLEQCHAALTEIEFQNRNAPEFPKEWEADREQFTQSIADASKALGSIRKKFQKRIDKEQRTPGV